MTESDTTALSEALLRQAEFLRALARGLLRDEHASDDVVQSTWVAALERGAQPLRTPRAWLACVARNLAIQRRREAGRRAERELAAARPESLGASSEPLEQEETLRSVTEAVLALDEPYRSTILMRYFEGLGPTEIAERRREPLATIRSRHARALALLRARLDRAHGGNRRAWSLGLVALVGERPELAGGVGAVAGVTTGALIMTVKLKLVAAAAVLLLALAALRFGAADLPWRSADVPAAPEAVIEDVAAQASTSSDSGGARLPTEPTIDDAGASARGVEPLPAASPVARWTGRVVDDRRMPVTDASISVRLGASSEWTARSASDGAFEVPIHEDPRSRADASDQPPLLVARGPDGAIAVKLGSIPGAPVRRGYDLPPAEEGLPTASFGTIVLEAPCSLDVTASEQGAGALGATVEVETAELHFRVPIASAETDPSGVARFDALPPGLVRVRATRDGLEASATLCLPDDAATELALAPTRDFLVETVDAETGEPIQGARVTIQESYPIPARFDEDTMSRQDVYTNRKLVREPAVTGSDGRARLERLPSTGSFDVDVEAAGYRMPYGIPPSPRLPRLQAAVEVQRIALKRAVGRTVRWPIVAGEAPAPPDGATIELRYAPGSRFGGEDAVLPWGRMEGSTLVVDALEDQGESGGRFRAEAPDGSLALLWIAKGSDLGKEASFRRPREIEVIVRDARGAPAPDVATIARSQGNNPLSEFVRTDQEGRAVLTGLYGGLADVHVVPSGSVQGFVLAGSVDLEKGDGHVEVVLPALFRARVAVRIDGARRLPGRFACFPRPVEESPERGELIFELAVPEDGDPASIWLAPVGYVPASVAVAPPGDGSEPVVEVELIPSGELIVDARRAPKQRVEVFAERFDETKGTWGPDRQLRMFDPIRTPNGPGGGFRIAGLAHGRWRAVDKSSGIASNEVEISRSALRARVVLDVASVQWVSGRVEVPAGEDVTAAVVLVDGADTPTDTQWRFPGEAPPPGASVSKDGSFRVRIPGDRVVTVRPWHPWLAPAEGGLLRTSAGLDAAVLRLARGRELRIPAEDAARAGSRSLRIAAFSGEIGSSAPLWIYAPLVDGVARTADLAPGRWSLWIDANERFAPVTLRDVEIGGGVTTLAPLNLSSGSSIRVRVRVPEDEAPPRIYVSATSISEPKYWRDVNSNGEREVVLSGLSAGRYTLDVSRIMEDRRSHPREIELDGAGELVVEFPP